MRQSDPDRRPRPLAALIRWARPGIRTRRATRRTASIDDDFPKLRVDDLLLLKRLAESGEVKPVIDRRYPLEEIVDAHRYVEEGHKRGNVIVTVGHSN